MTTNSTTTSDLSQIYEGHKINTGKMEEKKKGVRKAEDNLKLNYKKVFR